MTRPFIRAITLIATVGFVSMSQLRAAPDAWTGWITDEHCDPKGARTEHKACVLKALDRGADLRLYDVATGKRHPLDDQALAKRHIGYLVTVEGDMMSKLLRVRSIAQAPEPKLLLLDEARPGAPPSTTSSTGSTRASGEAAHSEVATPGTRRAAP